MASGNQLKFGVGYQIDKASVQKVKQSLRQLQNVKLGDFSGSTKEFVKMKDLADQVGNALNKAFNVNLNSLNTEKFNQQLGLSTNKINEIYTLFSKAGATGQRAFSSLTSSILTTNLKLKQTKSLITTMGQTMANTVKWGIASSVMNTFTNSVRQAFEYVKNLDSALTDIRIVTGDSTQKMAQFADQANKAAQSLGRSTMDYSKAALTFYQQGLNEEDVAARTQSTLVAQNITGAGQEMADYLTAVWNGYKVANEEAELYVDKLAAVADSSASNMSQLAVAMSKVASTANMLGVPVDSLNAQIATIVATTRQAPESVGNALKTIYARINDISTGSQDAQISLGNYSSKMAEVGINVLDASGHLRDTGDVIDEVGQKWNTLSREQQIYLARTMAGQRQYNNLLALFENWGRYTDLVNISMDAQGAAMEKNSRYMESLAAKMEQLGAAGERVKSALVDQNDLKGITDFGTKTVNLFASLIESIGGGGNAMLAFGSIVVSIFSNTIAKEINGFITNLQNIKFNAEQTTKQFQLMKVVAESNGANEAGTSAMLKQLEAAKAYYAFMTPAQQNQYNQTAQEIAKLETQADVYDKLRSKASGMFEVFNNHTFYKDFEQFGNAIQQRFVQPLEHFNFKDSEPEIFRKLKGQYEDLKAFINDNELFIKLQGTNQAEELLDKLKQKGSLSKDEIFALRQALLTMGKDAKLGAQNIEAIDDLAKKLGLSRDQAALLKEELAQTRQQLQQFSQVKTFIDITAAVGRLASAITSLRNINKIWSNESLSFGEKLLQTFTNLGMSLSMLGSSVLSIIKSIGALVVVKTEDTAITVAQIAADYGLATAIKAVGLAAKDAAVSLISFMASAAPFIAIGAAIVGVIYATVKALNRAKDAAQQANKQFESANKIYKDTKQSIDDLKSSWDSLQSARDNLNELTTGTEQWKSALEEVNSQVMELIQKYPELAQYARVGANGAMEISEQGYQAFLEQQQKASQVNGLITASARERQTSANNNYTIQQASRDMGLGIFNNTLLTNLVDAINNGNTNLLDNEAQLRELTNGNQNLIDKIQNHKDQIIKLAENVKENSDKTQALTTAMIESEILDPEQVAKSYNPAAFSKVLADQYQEGSQARQQAWLKENDISIKTGAVDTKNLDSLTLQGLGYAGYSTNAAGKIIGDVSFLESLGLNDYEVIFSEEDKEKILNSYKELNSNIADRIQYSGGDLIQILDQTGKEVEDTLRFEDIVSALADAEANIDYESWLNKFNTLTQQLGSEQLANQIVGAVTGTMEAGKIAISDVVQILADPDKIKQIADATGKDVEEVQQALLDSNRKTRASLTEYFNSIPTIVGDAIKDFGGGTDLPQLSEQVQKIIGTSLQNALKNGTYDEYLEVLNGIQLEDIPEFTSFIDSIGEEINSMDVSTFKEKLQELGISTKDLANDQIQLLINKIREANNISLQENVGQLYDGATSFLQKYAKDSSATLNSKEFESLSGIATSLNMDLSQFFEETWKGSYKLKGTAEEFFNYVNNQTLDGFKAAIEEAEDRVSQLQGLKELNQQGATIQDIQKANEANSDYSITNSLNFLQGIGQTTVGDINIQELLEHTQLYAQYIDDINNALAQHEGQWNDLDGTIQTAEEKVDHLKENEKEATLELAEFNQQYREMMLDSDVKADDWKNMTAYIQQAAQGVQDFDGDGLDDLSDSLMTDSAAAEDLSQQILRFSAAAEQAADKYDTWKEQLNSTDWGQQIAAGQQLQNVYSDILGLPFDTLSAGFAQDAENLQYLETVLWGDEEAAQAAYNQLAFLAEQDYETRFGISDESLAQFDTDLNTIRSTIANGIDDLAVGAYIDDANVYQQMNALINAADMTAQEASDLLASMGVDAEIEEVKTNADDVTQLVNATPQIEWEEVEIPNIYGSMFSRTALTHKMNIPKLNYNTDKIEEHSDKSATATALRVKSARKSSGGNIGVKRQNIPAKKGTSNTGGSSPKGSSSTPKAPKIEKHSAEKIDIKEKQPFVNPYEQIENSYERQEDLLKDLSDLQGNLVGKDRLDNLKKQNEQLKKQNKTIKQRQKLSKNAGVEGTTAWYKKQLQNDDALKGVVKFDEDGQINETESKNAAASAYNATAKKIQDDFNKVQDDYNLWLDNVWNKYSGEQQEAHKADKEARDQDLKEAKTKAQEEIKLADEVYNKRIKNIDQYQKALENDEKFHEQYIENLKAQIENQIEESKIKVDLSIDFGQLQRDFLDFNNKVVKKLSKDDIFGNAKASVNQIMSYFNSQELSNMEDKILETRRQLDKIASGGFSNIYGLSKEALESLTPAEIENLRKEAEKQAKEDLEEYTKQYMDSLEDIEDLHEEIRDLYLDSIDDAKDKMDDIVSQFERINDLAEHNIKLVQLLYGDNAGFEVLNKYYEKQEQNNLKTIKTLRQQADYWLNRMNNAEVGSEQWKKFKENYEDTIDQVNSILENQLELIATKFENRIKKAIKDIQNDLTGGLGNDYLEQEWDYINKDDEAFLDVVNSRFGIEQVTKAYQDAVDSAGSPAQQQKMNKLMNDQLKILKEKDRLTQYDIDRAKAALEVEKARMALEDARYSKTRMRLRRDSQGNYTYQYVEDEEKLSDLQSALSEAQNELYNMDKDHYKQQLNQMYQVYKDYLEQRAELQRQMETTQDEEEKERIKARIQLMDQMYTKYADDTNADLQYILTNYLTGSYADALGLDFSNYTPAQQVQVLKDNLPYTNTQMQTLSEQIERQGGLAKACTQYFKDLAAAGKEYATDTNKALKAAGTSVDQIASGQDDQATKVTKEFIDDYKEWGTEARNVISQMETLLSKIDEFLKINMDDNPFLNSLQQVYQTLQKINSLDGTTGATIIDYMNPDKTSNKELKNASETQKSKNNEGSVPIGLSNSYYEEYGRYNQAATQGSNIANRVFQTVKAGKLLTQQQVYQWLDELDRYQRTMRNSASAMDNIQRKVQQDVTISANFPNVENHNEIKEAFDILNNMASQRAFAKNK